MDRPLFTGPPHAGDKALVVANDIIGVEWPVGTQVMVVYDPLLKTGEASVMEDLVPIMRIDDTKGLNCIKPGTAAEQSAVIDRFNEAGTFARWKVFEDGAILGAEIAPLPM